MLSVGDVGDVPDAVRRRVQRRRALEDARRADRQTGSRGIPTRPTSATRRSSTGSRCRRRRSRTSPAARVLAQLGDSITTDHISPAGSIKKDSPAGKYLMEHGVEPRDFNSYGARRGNHEVMMRGTFANIRLRNQLAPGHRRRVDDVPARRRSDDDLRRRDEVQGRGRAADRPRRQGIRLGLVARLGGQGHAAARREGGHRRKLRAHPPQQPGQHGRAAAAVPGGAVRFVALSHRVPRRTRSPESPTGCVRPAPSRCARSDEDGKATEFQALVRIDTPEELVAFKHGGILPYVLRQLVGKQ